MNAIKIKINTMKNIITFCFCAFVILPLWAQIDEKRMQRDLDISKNILSSLMEEEGYGHIIERRIEASYIKGFGVIFNIPESPLFFNYNFSIPEPKIPEFGDDAGPFKSGSSVYIYSDRKASEDLMNAEQERMEAEEERMHAEQERMEAEQNMREVEQEKIRAEEKLEETMKNKNKDKDHKNEVIVKEHSHILSDNGESDQDRQEREEALEKTIITFLSDYADLIGQLKPEDKIMVKKESDHESFSVIWTEKNGKRVETDTGNGMSISALKKDVSDYKTNKLDRDEFVSRLDIKKGKKKERMADLEIFGNVFRQYFSPEYSKSFFTAKQPDYERLEGMGVIFQAQTFASYQGDQLFYTAAKSQSSADEKELKEKIESLYPKFLDDLKSFIVDYGRTIRSLKENEKLIMRVELTRCDACSTPRSIEATVPMSALTEYDQQKISKEKALAAIDIKEVK